VSTAVDTFLLSAADISAPLDGVIAGLFRPVADPLKLIFRFAQWAIAVIHTQRIAEVEPAIAIYVEGGHCRGVAIARAIEPHQARVQSGCRTGTVERVVRTVAIKAKAEISDQGRANAVH